MLEMRIALFVAFPAVGMLGYQISSIDAAIDSSLL